MKFKNYLVALFISLALILFPGIVKAEGAEGAVAKISETGVYYETLDEAVAAASDGATIVLLDNATTEGLNLSKNLTIQGEKGENDENYTITFTKYGIALWGKALTFKNVDVIMEGIGSTPYTAEWNWMTICASRDASLTLDNVKMTMDGQGLDKHAIYFCSNNKLNILNGSVLTIKNYVQDALEWDGGDGGYNVNITDSTYISDHNRSGFTGTFYATIDNSKVRVINSRGYGSNGTYYTIMNHSNVLFDGNVNWGISAWRIDMTNYSTLTATNNGYSGVWTRVLNVDSTCTLDVEGNGTKATGFTTNAGIFFQGNGTYTSTIEKGANVTIKNNAGSGIYTAQSVCNLTILSGTITNNGTGVINANGQKGATYGGGIYNVGTLVLGEDVVLYNNHADTAGDDIYNTKVVTFYSVGSDWYLDGQYDCSDLINGWYEDGYVSEDGIARRWQAHSTPEFDHYEIFEPGEINTPFAIKAAHDKLGTVEVSYIDEKGNSLLKDEEGNDETITLIGSVGEDYQTEKKAFDDYTFVKVKDDNATGEFIDGKVDVIYMYAKNSNVVVSYITDEGIILHDDVTLDGYVGKEYTTEEKTFEGYALLEVIGDRTGQFKDETIQVTYIYQYVLGQGGEDIEPEEPSTPVVKTGIEENNSNEVLLLTSSTLLAVMLILKKRFI